jgi:hypothetical protein
MVSLSNHEAGNTNARLGQSSKRGNGAEGHDFGAFAGLLRARGLLRGTIDAEKEYRGPPRPRAAMFAQP